MKTINRTLYGAAIGAILVTGCAQDTEFSNLEVFINPQKPTENDRLYCQTSQIEDSFEFLWFINDYGPIYGETGFISSLDPSYTTIGDRIECSVWTKNSAYYDGFEAGYDKAQIF